LKTVNMDVEKIVAEALAQTMATPTADKIVPGVFDEGVVETVTKAIIASQK